MSPKQYTPLTSGNHICQSSLSLVPIMSDVVQNMFNVLSGMSYVVPSMSHIVPNMSPVVPSLLSFVFKSD